MAHFIPDHSLSADEVVEIRDAYLRYGSRAEVIRNLGYCYATINKYIPDLLPTNEHIINTFILTGSLDSTAYIHDLSRTIIWRRLQKHSIIVGRGADSWKKLYATLRARVVRSDWRKAVLIRDKFTCTKCGQPSRTVHHVVRLAFLRDKVLKSYPHIDPYRSRTELVQFLDLVMSLHEEKGGVVLCSECHKQLHHPNSKRREMGEYELPPCT